MDDRPGRLASRGEPAVPSAPGGSRVPSVVRAFAVVALVVTVAAALFLARDVLVPVALALFIALILHLPMAAAERRGVPRALSAIALVGVLSVLVFVANLVAVKPAQELLSNYPVIELDLRRKLFELRKSLHVAERAGGALSDVAEDVAEMVRSDGDSKSEEVVVRERSLMARAAASFAQAMTTVVVALVVCVFVLATPRPFLTLATLPFRDFPAKRQAARIWHSVEREVAHYLLVISVINGALGVVVGAALWLVGMPVPTVWGVAAALLNYMPFVGPSIGAVAMLAVAIVSFDSMLYALVPPAVYVGINFVEANFVTPSFVGNRMKLPPLAIVLSLVFWGWLWGFIGLLISVPALVVLKVVADKVPSLGLARRLLTQRGGNHGDRRAFAAKGESSDTEFRRFHLAQQHRKSSRAPDARDVTDTDLAQRKMGDNALQGDDQARVHNQRRAVPDVRQETDGQTESLEKIDKDVRAERDLGKGNRDKDRPKNK